MKQLLKRIISQDNINLFYHLPKAILANILYGFPTRKLKVIGITGTDGKTTTTNMVYRILRDCGKKVSMVSTINAPGFHVTSPDPFMVQKFAQQAVSNGDEYLVLEVTSHGLDQYRFWGINFEVGVITNITHEHLDYHKTFENYSQAKLSLLKNVKYAVLNQNLLNGSRIKYGMTKIVTFGLNKGDFNQRDLKLRLKIPGDYNLENALAAMATAFVLEIPKKVALKALEDFEGVKGRMEEVKNNKGIKIVVDFAHTPNGLEQALRTLRRQSGGRLIAVFGSAGKRDIKKRFLMGKIAGKLADIAVITAEDPRGELEKINLQIVEGIMQDGGMKDINFFLMDNREKAISFAINKLAKRGDTVAIFGKGHEESINLDGKVELPWSDFDAVQKALNGYQN